MKMSQILDINAKDLALSIKKLFENFKDYVNQKG